MPGMTFRLWRCRATFLTRAAVRFPAHAGNAFRGALGHRLEDEFFRPRASAGPSGLRDRPRPFVLRASDLDGAVIVQGGRFELTLNVFAESAVDALRRALAECGSSPRLAGCELTAWEAEPLDLDLAPRPAPQQVRVLFRTPLALKGWDGEGLPPFAVLAARLRDRIAALAAFHGGGAPEWDYAAMGSRAALVQTLNGQVEKRQSARRSTRTGRTHSLTGVTGWVDYSGPLDEFLPLLEAGYWTGVGRHTVWGQGWIEIAEPGAPSISTVAP